ncbi:MAG: NAD(P)H:quinone oxidoreductase [Armatimonadetes bacterium]|nr:NAD(P)H:quinone oxidoreductase [Armatimonadota bacterium]
MQTPVNLLIAFYSRDGHTEALAKEIQAGAEAAGASVRIRRAREIVSRDIMAKSDGWIENADRMNALYEAPTTEDAEWADGVIFGTPTRFGNVSSELKAYVDSMGGLWFQGKMVGKAGSTFSSTGALHGGNESTNITMYNFLAHLGMIIVPLGYADPVLFEAGTPYGATTYSLNGNRPVSDKELEVARFQGKRVAEVARVLKTLR